MLPKESHKTVMQISSCGQELYEDDVHAQIGLWQEHKLVMWKH